MSDFIIGGGVGGLIAGFYKDAYIITDKVGGWQNLNRFRLGPRLLEVTEKTTNFLRKLELDYSKTKKIKIGYYNEGFTSLNEEFRNTYGFKTRELAPEEIHKSVLSSGKNELTVFDIDYDLILKTLEGLLSKKIFVGKVHSINHNAKVINGTNDNYYYENLVNALPQNMFQKMSGLSTGHDFSAFHTTFFKCEYNDFFNKVKDEGYNYFYSIDKNHIWHRCSLFNEYVSLETKGKIETIPDVKILDKVTLPFAQLKHSYKDLQFTFDVENAGRFAEWNHSIKMEELIERYER
jgi:hypothetical protein